MLDPIVNLTIRDAIAYTYFLENITEVLNEDASPEAIALLASCSFNIADVFCAVRDSHECNVKVTRKTEEAAENND